jgi:DNA polymerase-1
VAKLLLLDGNSLTYRAFFALPTDMATSSGQVTNAVFGFTSMLINLLRDQRPDGVVVLFDRPEPTFRHDAVPEYKAQREAAPDILRQQMGLVRQVVNALGIEVSDLAGYEADDLIATLATRGRDLGLDIVIVTGDRDTYQLVEDPHIAVLYNRRGVSDYVLYDEAGIFERCGVTPMQYPEYAALRGDPSDNLAGVPGVGEKTAAKLIATYGGLDGIFANLDKQTPKLRESLAANEIRVRKNAEVMVLRRDAPIDVDLGNIAALGVQPPDLGEVKHLFEFLEFRSLFERLAEVLDAPIVESHPTEGRLTAEVAEVDAKGAVETLAGLAAGDEPISIGPLWVGAPGRSDLLGLAFATGEDTAMWVPAALLADDAVKRAVVNVFASGSSGVRVHHAKSLMRTLFEVGLDIEDLELDTSIAAYLLDPAESRYAIGDLLARYTGLELGTRESNELQLDLDGSGIDDRMIAALDAVATARLAPALEQALEHQGMRTLYDTIENPLVRVLARMERVGVGVDVTELRALNDRLVSECKRLDELIQIEAGIEFNVNSTHQLREVLFDKLGLAPQKKTKTGYSTDAASLERLRDQHPIIEMLLSYREFEKLRSTYGEGLLNEVAPDGRIHASFNQTVARTGRLSSDQPNLHNIPVRSDEGRQFRKAFVPAEGFEMLVADYNQIELRCIAHLAEDPGLIAAFDAGTDIHTETASRVFGVDKKKVTGEQRAKAKMVSYGLAYGMEAYGLGQRLNIPTEEAAEILDAYFVAFPSVKQYMERTVNEARQRGYTETLFGRRRPIPELSSPNFRIRQAGERQAMNAGIQGLAADIFKVALVRLDHELEARGLASRLILQVHDEVILEVAPAEHEEVTELTQGVMKGAVELRVPLEVHLAFGPSWAEAKS